MNINRDDLAVFVFVVIVGIIITGSVFALDNLGGVDGYAATEKGEVVEFKVGQEKFLRLEKGAARLWILYAGMPSEESFSLAREFTDPAGRWGYNLYYPSDTKKIQVPLQYKNKIIYLEVIDVSPTKIKLKFLKSEKV